MIYCIGTASEIEEIKHQLTGKPPFVRVEDVGSAGDLTDADLFLLGPSIESPVKLVREITKRYPLVSIIVLTHPNRYIQIKQSLLFSMQVGKNASCVVYNASTDYNTVFEDAMLRTRQRRGFNKFNAAVDAKLVQFTSPSVKLDGVGDILEHAPIGAVLVDAEFKIVGANRASKEMFGQLRSSRVPLASVFGNHYNELVSLLESGGAGKSLVVDNQHGHYFDVRTFSVRNHNVEQNILLFNDVTETREKNRRVAAILESLPLIAWTSDPDGNANYFNHGWYNYTNVNPSAAMGDGWALVVHPDDLGVVSSKWQSCMKEGKSYEQACRLRRSDGEYRWHLSKASPIRTKGGEIEIWVGTAMDIHDQVLLNENLERKVKERTKLLEQSNAELEQFAHISSHDLQEPLRKIKTFAHIIKDEDYDSLAENGKRYLDKIILTSERMTNLVKDLLKFTKINQREPEVLVDLNELIRQIREDLELSISQNEVTLSLGELPTIKGRPLQIKQLFYNLISNSIKYRRPDLHPAISITCIKFIDNVSLKNLPQRFYWEIIIKDNGIGFDQKYAEQIFTVFQRLHTRSAYEGTGIGLAIARKVVANHSGEIFAVSSPGNGAEFHIILPAVHEVLEKQNLDETK